MMGCTPLLLVVPRKVMVMNRAAMMLETSLSVRLDTTQAQPAESAQTRCNDMQLADLK
jgi:hypothetical protein